MISEDTHVGEIYTVRELHAFSVKFIGLTVQLRIVPSKSASRLYGEKGEEGTGYHGQFPVPSVWLSRVIGDPWLKVRSAYCSPVRGGIRSFWPTRSSVPSRPGFAAMMSSRVTASPQALAAWAMSSRVSPI